MRNKLIGTKGGTPAGIAEREHRLSTPRPVATSALAHPVRRKTPQSGLLEERSEEYTSELQSRGHIVCRLLLETQKTQTARYSQTQRKTQRHHMDFSLTGD